jgi:hypothetical protein
MKYKSSNGPTARDNLPGQIALFDESPKATDAMTTVATNEVLTEHVDAIRQLGKRVVEDVIEIGRRLVDCRENHLAHGQWLPWLKMEFGWTDRTARNFINVYDQSESENFSDLNLPVSSLYLLCAPSTPEETRSEIIERARSGKPVSVDEVKKSIAAAKDRKKTKKRKQAKDVNAGADNAGDSADADANASANAGADANTSANAGADANTSANAGDNAGDNAGANAGDPEVTHEIDSTARNCQRKLMELTDGYILFVENWFSRADIDQHTREVLSQSIHQCANRLSVLAQQIAGYVEPTARRAA